MMDRAGEIFIRRRTPESAAFTAEVERTMALTAAINRLGFADHAAVAALFGELTGQPPGEGFHLAPPFYADYGRGLRVGARVFINQNCTVYAFGGVVIGDDVLIGPNVSLLGSGHPVAPSRRRSGVVGRPIAIEDGVWIAAGATILGGVTVGVNAVVAAGSVVTRDVAADTLVAGNPARVVRSLAGE